MPRAGLTMVEGTISSWKVAEGAQVNKGDVVMEFENEKNTIEYEIVHGGFLHIVAQEGDTVAVAAPIAYVADTKAQYDALVSGGAAPAAAAAPVASAAPVAALEDEVTQIPWTGVRRTIARNMFNSLQTTAQNTCTCKVDVTELLELRQKFVADAEALGCKITVNDLLCKMLGKVIAKHPLANATFDGKTLYTHKHVHLSVAVATEDGLMVPVVRNIDTLTLTEINAQIKTLAQQAKDKTLPADAQSGGTFTITNVGMFPIDTGTPVINLPQTAICGFGRPVLEPAVLPDGTIGPRQKMNVFLTFDHQVIDGLECGR